MLKDDFQGPSVLFDPRTCIRLIEKKNKCIQMCRYSYDFKPFFMFPICSEQLCASQEKTNIESFNSFAFRVSHKSLTEGKPKHNPRTVGFCKNPWRMWVRHIFTIRLQYFTCIDHVNPGRKVRSA